MVNYCPECGTEFQNRPDFCPECGHEVKSVNSTETNTVSNATNAESRQRQERKSRSGEGNQTGVDFSNFGTIFLRGVVLFFLIGIVAAGIATITGDIFIGIILGVIFALGADYFYYYQLGKASVSNR